MTQTIYHYHPQTGEYVGSGFADPSPLEPDTYLVPAHATATPPPAAAAAEAAVHRDGAWALVPDHRGTTYWLADGSEHHITDLGAAPPPEALDAPPPPAPPTIDDLKAEAGRRLAPTDWYVVRQADPSDSTPVPDVILTYRAAVRAAAAALEQTLPMDYRDDAHWPEPVA